VRRVLHFPRPHGFSRSVIFISWLSVGFWAHIKFSYHNDRIVKRPYTTKEGLYLIVHLSD